MTLALDLEYPERRYRLISDHSDRFESDVRTMTESDARMWERYMGRAYATLSFRLEVEDPDGWIPA